MWWRRLRYLLLLIALCSIATCPAAKRACTANARAEEAEDLLGYLASRVDVYYAATGKLPPTPAGPTPVPGCCDQSGTCSPDPSLWATPGWKELGFSIDGSFRYTYSYTPDPGGHTATVRAVGDLDCDEAKSTYEVKLTTAGPLVLRSWKRTSPTE
ncbi:MAG TPA: hypothetical protein VGM90_23045 [Kofleriaceae bacterium]|jgi:hypothetical protein